jgi:hypothetical protein
VGSDRRGDIKILFNIVWRGARMPNVDHSALLCTFGAEHKAARRPVRRCKHPPNDQSPSWRGLIRPGRFCFFCVEFSPVAPLRDGSGSIVQIWLIRNRQSAHTLLNRRKQAPPFAIRRLGYSAWSIIAPLQRAFWCPRCLEELRRRSPRRRVSPRSETERRRRQERVHSKPGAR